MTVQRRKEIALSFGRVDPVWLPDRAFVTHQDDGGIKVELSYLMAATGEAAIKVQHLGDQVDVGTKSFRVFKVFLPADGLSSKQVGKRMAEAINHVRSEAVSKAISRKGRRPHRLKDGIELHYAMLNDALPQLAPLLKVVDVAVG